MCQPTEAGDGIIISMEAGDGIISPDGKIISTEVRDGLFQCLRLLFPPTSGQSPWTTSSAVPTSQVPQTRHICHRPTSSQAAEVGHEAAMAAGVGDEAKEDGRMMPQRRPGTV
jgi:hypothetical protein